MPIGYSPEDYFPVSCSLDEHLTERMKWNVRAVSVAETRKIRQLREEARAIKNDEELQNTKLNEAILMSVSGWSLPDPLDASALDKHLLLADKFILTEELPQLVDIGAIEKKISRLQQASAAARSAKDAQAASVTTPPAS